MSATTRRTKNAETLLSLTILGILIAIGLVILAAQNRFNPAAENFTSEIDETATLPVDSTGNDIAIPVPTDIQPMSPGERFDPETLSDKINGKAELYLSAGFVELTTQRFRVEDDANVWFEAFVYDMGMPSNAFAVYSGQRRQGVEKLSLTRNAYGTSNALFFITGHYYVELIAATAGPEVLSLLTNFAEHYLAQVAEDDEIQEEPANPQQVFPAEGLVADTVTLIAKDAFGFDRLDQVYTGQYRGEGTETTLFVSTRSSPVEAGTLAVAYRDFLIEFGGLESPAPLESPLQGVFVVEILDAYEVVFSRGPYLAGVHMAEDKDVALQLADQLERHLSE